MPSAGSTHQEEKKSSENEINQHTANKLILNEFLILTLLCFPDKSRLVEIPRSAIRTQANENNQTTACRKNVRVDETKSNEKKIRSNVSTSE